MSVVVDVSVTAGRFVPFRGVNRATGPVASVHVNAEGTGDGSGGSMRINIQMAGLNFGFHSVLVPTRVQVHDNLAAVEVVQLLLASGGNERLTSSLIEHKLTVRSGALNAVDFEHLSVPMEAALTQLTEEDAVSAVWQTNTNAKVYHVHLFAIVYDGEAIARKFLNVPLDTLFYGVR